MNTRVLVLFCSLMILPPGPAAVAQSLEQETFSLYGYLVSYTLGGADDWGAPGVGHTLLLRLKGDWSPQESLEFHVETSWTTLLGDQNPHPRLESAGLAPAPQTDFPYQDFTSSFLVDHVWGLVNLGMMDLQIGKIPIGWGTGYIFNPTAKTASGGILDTVTEETPGTVSIVPTAYLGGALSMAGYLAFQERSGTTVAMEEGGELRNLPFGLKIQSFFGPFDVTGGIVKEVFYGADGYVRNLYGVLDFDGGIQGVGLYGEVAVRLPSDSGLDPVEDIDAVVGLYATMPGVEVDLRTEYFRQGSGTRLRDGDADLMVLLSGKRPVLAEDYLFVSTERVFLDYLTVLAAGLINLNDGSAVLTPEIRYAVMDNFEASLGVLALIGSADTEFGGMPGDPIGVYLRGKLSF